MITRESTSYFSSILSISPLFAPLKSLPSQVTRQKFGANKIVEKAAEFRKNGAEVIGVSIDSLFTHNAWVKTPQKQGGLGKIDIPLIADVNKSLSEA